MDQLGCATVIHGTNKAEEAAAIGIAQLTETGVMPKIEVPSGHTTKTNDPDTMGVTLEANKAGATPSSVYSTQTRPTLTPGMASGIAAKPARRNAWAKSASSTVRTGVLVVDDQAIQANVQLDKSRKDLEDHVARQQRAVLPRVTNNWNKT